MYHGEIKISSVLQGYNAALGTFRCKGNPSKKNMVAKKNGIAALAKEVAKLANQRQGWS